MSAHLHSTFVDGCYRCELSRDEVEADRDRLVEILLPYTSKACTCIELGQLTHAQGCYTRQIARLAAEAVMRDW